jgi:hypothetical protein
MVMCADHFNLVTSRRLPSLLLRALEVELVPTKPGMNVSKKDILECDMSDADRKARLVFRAAFNATLPTAFNHSSIIKNQRLIDQNQLSSKVEHNTNF